MITPFKDGQQTKLVFYSPEYAEKLSEWYYGFDYRFFFRDFSDPLNTEDLKNLHIKLSKSGVSLIIILDKASLQPIGLMTFLLEKPSARVYKFGILVDRDPQHKTKAIDAIIVFMEYAFHKCSSHKITVEFCDQDKHIHRICQIGGFVQEATLKEELFMDGIYFDEARYAIYPARFEELYSDYFS